LVFWPAHELVNIGLKDEAEFAEEHWHAEMLATYPNQTLTKL
jgi:hypothetical protein